jgi:hypothetical protein
MDEKRELLHHFLAAIAYRLQKALRGAPETFPEFRADQLVRTPHELVCHITSVLGYARTFFTGGTFTGTRSDWQSDVQALHAMLADFGRHLVEGTPFRNTDEKHMLQGPLADAMTHVGQIAMLRRLAGSPVPPENFIVASISSSNLGPDQPDPVSPDKVWPERPK